MNLHVLQLITVDIGLHYASGEILDLEHLNEFLQQLFVGGVAVHGEQEIEIASISVVREVD